MAEIKKLRTVQELHSMIVEADPESALSEYYVRQLVYSGELPSVKTGNKKLACFEDLVAYLFDGKRWTDEGSAAV